jgi:cystathionine beta-lyase family protein involved in aluminum resistance
MKNIFNLDRRLLSLDEKIMPELKDKFSEIDKITEYNQNKVLKAFVDNRVSESSFGGSTGYGYDDQGRETIERTFAQIVGAESSIFRHNFVSGTHALTVALFGVLRPGDTVVSVIGRPYDTILGVFGVTEGSGNLREFGVNYEEVDLLDSKPDKEAIVARMKKSFVKVAYIQRSRGYNLRPSLLVEEIAELTKAIKEASPDTIVMVDNCYGEFVQETEPTDWGADLIIGSLIKNAGGGIAPTGGYIAGRADLVEKCACRLTAPGIGGEVGATLGHSRELYMGLFNAPHVTGEALKTAVYAAKIYETLGFEVSPDSSEPRGDIIQTVTLGNPDSLIAFCQGMQKGAPVDSFVVPEPWDMPGYDNQVIMAAGSFTLGASIELSADAPMREPYAAWMQGGLNFHSAKTGILLATQSMLVKGLIKL